MSRGTFVSCTALICQGEAADERENASPATLHWGWRWRCAAIQQHCATQLCGYSTCLLQEVTVSEGVDAAEQGDDGGRDGDPFLDLARIHILERG